MSEELFVLTQTAIEKLEKGLEKLSKIRVEGTPDQEPPMGQTPEVYVAAPPCGQGIPGFDYETNKPGVQRCCIFRMVQLGDTVEQVHMIPLTNSDGEPLVLPIYNIYKEDIPPYPGYIKITKSKFGPWICEPASAFTTTTTTTSSVPTTTSTKPPCSGGCRWLWSVENSAWTLDLTNSECIEGTTTTTGEPTTTSSTSSTTTTTSLIQGICCYTTTTSPTTTTTGDPATSTTTTSTTTTTTTTSSPCMCVPPIFCGTEEGDCAYTTCSKIEFAAPVCSSTTTTTTTSTETPSTTTRPPCVSTPDPILTTEPPDGGGGGDGGDGGGGMCWGCTYRWTPWGWTIINARCNAPNCACGGPPNEGGSPCKDVEVGCVYSPVSPPVPPNPISCGSCLWYCDNVLGCWLISGCALSGCVCDKPPTCCGYVHTPCGVPVPPPPPTTQPPGPTTTPDPCRPTTVPPPSTSSTSTTSTTSTTGCATGGCKWKWSGSAWTSVSNSCPEETCPCGEPNYEGHGVCELAWTYCGTRSTTTTTSTTTTSTTTTSSTTTTTTTTCEPCKDGGTCSWTWDNFSRVWNWVDQSCGAGDCGCYCVEPSYPGISNGEGAATNCCSNKCPTTTTTTTTTSTTTTTTTSTTTTTTTTCLPPNAGRCLKRCLGGVVSTVISNCSEGYQCPSTDEGASCTSEGQCLYYDCVTTCHPCGSGCNCTWTWDGNSWVGDYNCGEMCNGMPGPCVCPPPANNGTTVGQTTAIPACGDPSCDHYV